MSVITIAFENHNIVIDNFGDNAMPRTYMGDVSFGQSANGTSILEGPAFRQKYQWVISTIMYKSVALDFDALFRDWDALRATGAAAACGIADTTWGSQVNANVIFATPPSYTRMSPQYVLVSFGLMEV